MEGSPEDGADSKGGNSIDDLISEISEINIEADERRCSARKGSVGAQQSTQKRRPSGATEESMLERSGARKLTKHGKEACDDGEFLQALMNQLEAARSSLVATHSKVLKMVVKRITDTRGVKENEEMRVRHFVDRALLAGSMVSDMPNPLAASTAEALLPMSIDTKRGAPRLPGQPEHAWSAHQPPNPPEDSAPGRAASDDVISMETALTSDIASLDKGTGSRGTGSRRNSFLQVPERRMSEPENVPILGHTGNGTKVASGGFPSAQGSNATPNVGTNSRRISFQDDVDHGQSNLSLATSVSSEGGHSNSDRRIGLRESNQRSSAGRNFLLLPIWDPKERPTIFTSVNPMYQDDLELSASLDVSKTPSFVQVALGYSGLNRGTLMGQERRRSRTFVASSFIINPNSNQRAVWDFISICLVAYDLIFIPLQFFNPPETAFDIGMKWITRIFWSLDIPTSFITGFLTHQGDICMEFGLIVRRYLSSWFALDVSIVTVDWFEEYGTGGDDGAFGFLRFGKASRVFRVIRMVRLLRLLRIREAIKLISERIQSEILVLVFGIFQITCVIILVSHLMACAWWSVGEAGDRRSWHSIDGIGSRSLGYRYLTSLHWSLSQFTGGMDEVRPMNFGERLYTVCSFLMCFISAAVILSALTSSMTRLHIIASGQSKQFSTLRKYLFQNKITSRLAVRIQRNAQHALTEQERSMPEKSVALLALVNEPLRIDLHFEIFAPALSVHPFFERYITECPQVLRKVCHSATSYALVSTGDVIFETGEIPTNPKMYIVASGNLVYSAISGPISQVEYGHWISEGALWTAWMHRGALMANSEICKLVIIEAFIFQEIVSQFEHADFDPRFYAQIFVQDLNSYANDVTDLPFEFQSASWRSHAAAMVARQTPRWSSRPSRS